MVLTGLFLVPFAWADPKLETREWHLALILPLACPDLENHLAAS